MGNQFTFKQLNAWPRLSFVALLGFIAGLIITACLELTNPIIPLCFLIAVSIAAFIPFKAIQDNRIILIIFFCFFTVASIQQSQNLKQYQNSLVVRDQLITAGLPIFQVSGTVSQSPRSPLDKSSFWLSKGAQVSVGGKSYKVPGQILVSVYALDEERFHLGDKVDFIGEAIPVSETFDSRDWERHLSQRGSTIRMNAERLIRKESSTNIFHTLVRRVGAFGDEVEIIYQEELSEDAASFLSAVTLGRIHSLSDENYKNAQRSGIAHLFAVSGLHTGIIGLMLIFLGRLLMLPPKGEFIFVSIGLLAFVALVGFRPSAIRAAIFLLVWMAQRSSVRRVDSLSILTTTALLMLLFSPMQFWRIDFQMSFLCMIVLFVMLPQFTEQLDDWQEKLRDKFG